MEKRLFYTITKWNLSEGYANGYSLGLEFKSVQDCKKVIKLAGIPSWEIRDQNDKPVEFSPSYLKFDSERTAEREKQEKEDREKAVRLNALPNIYPIDMDLPKGLKVWIQKGKAEYDPKISSRAQYSLNCKWSYAGKSGDFWVSRFISRNGSIMKNIQSEKKSFAKECNWEMKEIADIINTDNLLVAIVNKYQDVERMLRNA